MLIGLRDPQTLASRVARMPTLDTAALVLDGVETLQLLCEIESAKTSLLLPPSLHPTLPGIVNWQVQHFPTSPWGPFRLAQTRIECRSGLRPRVFLLRAVCDQRDAALALAERWGFAVDDGSVTLDRGYDRIEARAAIDGRGILRLELRDPETLRPDDVQYVANLNLAETPRGLRLVQVDADFRVERAERGRPRVLSFDAASWGEPDVVPLQPVSASFTVGSVTLPSLRFLCRPEVSAFEGTEKV